MKEHTSDFKTQIKELGRQFKFQVKYGNTTLEEELYSVTPHFKGNMLKSTMKQLDVETTEDIPVGTEVNYKLGLLIEDEYEWLDYGNYIVYSSEKQEDKGTYKLVCYDKLLNSMVTYDGVEGTFPMTLREYLQAICDKLDIDFGSANDEFANYDRVLPSDRYEGLEEYTYRDVLDEIAQATGSMICLNNDDELVVRYINEGIDNYNTVTGTSFSLTDADGGLSSSIYQLEGNTTQNGTPTPTSPVEISTVSGDNEVVVCGKNLLPLTTQNFTLKNVNYYVQNGSLFLNGTSTGETTSNDSNFKNNFSFVLNAGTYNFRWSYILGVSAYIKKYEDNTVLAQLSQNISNKSFTLTEPTRVFLGFYVYNATASNKNIEVQISKGTTATTYEPYVGNSYRVDFGGKNLVKITGETRTINGVTFTQNSDGSISVKGTATANASFISTTVQPIEPNRRMKLSGCPSGGSTSTYRLILRVRSDTTTNIVTVSNLGSGGNDGNVPAYSNAHYILGEIIVYSGQTVDLTFYPQVEYVNSSTDPATQYSPYVSNPIELCKIGNYVDSIKKSTGKNKADTENATVLNGYFDGSHTTVTSASTNRTTYFKVQPNTTYTVSKLQSIRSFIGVTQTLPDIGTSITQIKNIGSSTFDGRTRVSGTITTGSNDNYIVVNYANVNTDTGTQADTIKNSIMLNEGSTALPYEPYGNNWYIEKNIGKVVLNGTENWAINRSGTANWYYYANISSITIITDSTSSNTLCDHYTWGSVGVSNTNTGYYIVKNGGQVRIRYGTEDTVANYKTWLGNNNVTLYYPLATPSYEIITNENLIQQLNNIQNIELIENLCYVDWVGTEKPTMTLKYYQGRTLEEINEEYLKDVNVDFGEKYGPVNSIVLSRSGESDNVYIQDEDSIEENGLHELKIVDNQLMNFNDRSDYLPNIFEKLDGLEYYINDYTSTGICYLELGDRYYVNIGDNTYSCVMFNDEIEITGGLKEFVYTDMPEETQTDYTKADKTDRRINQTYLIVDKQNQKIQSLVNEIGDRSEKTTTVTQDIDSIEAKVEAFADVTVEEESNNAVLNFEKINASEPIMLKVHPLSNTNITYSYYGTILYPSDTTYSNARLIRFIRTYEEGGETKTENIDYEIPADLLYYNANNYDEFILDYVNKQCKVIKKCAYNASGQVVLTGSTQTIEYEYPSIILNNGDYQIKLVDYNVGYIYAKLMTQNEYTSQFATEVQVQSQIRITAEGIESEVSRKVGNDEIISRINQSAEGIQINADKISIEGKAVNFTTNIEKPYVFSRADIDLLVEYLSGREQLSSEQIELYDVNGDGFIDATDYVVIQKAIANNGGVINGTFSIDPYSTERSIILKQYDGTIKTYVGLNGIKSNNITGGTINVDGSLYVGRTSNEDATAVWATEDQISVRTSTSESVMTAYDVTTPEVIQTSREEDKKNFEKLSNGLDIILNTDIYKYHLKTQDDKDKKHIGFVIGDKFKHSREITSEKDNKEVGVDLYSMIAACYKAIQEQQNKIEELEKKIKGEK